MGFMIGPLAFLGRGHCGARSMLRAFYFCMVFTFVVVFIVDPVTLLVLVNCWGWFTLSGSFLGPVLFLGRGYCRFHCWAGVIVGLR